MIKTKKGAYSVFKYKGGEVYGIYQEIHPGFCCGISCAVYVVEWGQRWQVKMLVITMITVLSCQMEKLNMATLMILTKLNLEYTNKDDAQNLYASYAFVKASKDDIEMRN